MNEKLLQYLWNFKIFKNFDFKDTEGNEIEILDFGKWNYDSGPDFTLGKIKTKELVLAGNIELHVKTSDWVFHQHTGNPEFENIILHVVFNHDIEIDDFKKRNIPTIELRNYIDENLLSKYNSLLNNTQFIPCETIFNPAKIPPTFFDETLVKKLDERSISLEESLEKSQNNFEAVLFQNLAYAFGLKVNADIFKQIAESLDFATVNKIRQNKTQLEALFFGFSGWLENPTDEKTKIWQREFLFLKSKFDLLNVVYHPKFSKLRPPNFPTIRLSQLASLYFIHQNLFSKIISANKVEDIYQLFKDVKASEYWNNHFNFGKISSVESEKSLTKDFIDLIIINAILPLKYTYHKNHEENVLDEILNFYSEISPEKNSVISQWKSLKAPVKSALESQSLIYHYKNSCIQKKCLECGIGLNLLRN